MKGEAVRLLRSDSSQTTFKENIKHFRSYLRVRGYPDLVNNVLEDVIKFTDGKSTETAKSAKRLSVCHLKKI